MKQKHRRAHLLVWLLLIPLLVGLIYHAQQGRFAIEDEYGASAIPEQGGRL